MENPKSFFHVLGGIIEQPHILEVADETAFTSSEGVFLADSATQYGVVDSVATGKITLKKFSIGETITDDANSATGELLRIEGAIMYVKKLDTNLFVDGSILTGSTSAAKVTGTTVAGTPSATIGVVEQITIAKPSDSDGISDLASTSSDTTISDIIYHHYIFAWRDAPSYAMVWVYEDFDIGVTENPQKLHIGVVCESVALDVVSNDVPKIKQAWLISNTSEEDKKNAKQTNDVTTLYEWTNIPSSGVVVNAVDYSSLFKTINIEVKRKLGKIYGNSRNPKALRGATISSTLKIGIHRQDIVERNLVNDWGTSAGVAVVGTFVFNRGTALEDAFTVTFSTLRIPKISESVGDETILQELEFGIEGTPVIDAYDKIQYYGSSA